MSPQIIQIIVSSHIVSSPNSRGVSNKLGLFSAFLLDIKNRIVQERRDGLSLFCKVHNSAFKLPEKPASPIVCFANGAGIGMIRSLIQEKLHAVSNEVEGHSIGPISLFFGARTSADLLIKGDLETATRAKILKECKIALSREAVSIRISANLFLGRKENLRTGPHLRQ